MAWGSAIRAPRLAGKLGEREEVLPALRCGPEEPPTRGQRSARRSGGGAREAVESEESELTARAACGTHAQSAESAGAQRRRRKGRRGIVVGKGWGEGKGEGGVRGGYRCYSTRKLLALK